MILVYVKSFSNPSKGLTGVTAEKWSELLRDMSGQIREHVGKPYQLSDDEAALPIDKLVAKYSPPVVSAEP